MKIVISGSVEGGSVLRKRDYPCRHESLGRTLRLHFIRNGSNPPRSPSNKTPAIVRVIMGEVLLSLSIRVYLWLHRCAFTDLCPWLGSIRLVLSVRRYSCSWRSRRGCGLFLRLAIFLKSAWCGCGSSSSRT